MIVLMLTNEYPPHVYGGAGVHIEHLSRSLAQLDDGAHRIEVLAFGAQDERRGNLQVRGVQADDDLTVQYARHRKLLDALARNVRMTGLAAAPDIIHGHTWYTHLAGCLLQQLTGAPLVLTTHSLEAQRPWKAGQLGRAYRVTQWIERTAYAQADGVVAVSKAMKEDVARLYGVSPDKIQVIHNGIDPQVYRPTQNPAVLRKHGIDPRRPFVLFVGRISRQKGLRHLLAAVPDLPNKVQIVLCAGAADTRDLAAEIGKRVRALKVSRDVIWIEAMLPREELVHLYSHAAVFVCPSVYEPFGLINLEAMACGTPVVASAVGGIPEVVLDGETGHLVPLTSTGPQDAAPGDPQAFAHELGDRINALLEDPARARRMGAAGRARVKSHFTWETVARRTLDFYLSLIQRTADAEANCS